MSQNTDRDRGFIGLSGPIFHHNTNRGHDQILGLKTEIGGGAHNWFQNHLSGVIIGCVSIVALLMAGLGLGLGFGLRGSKVLGDNQS